MTLEQWKEVNPSYRVFEHASGCIYTLIYDCQSAEAKSLFDLSDYAVSTVSGPTYWLVKKQ